MLYIARHCKHQKRNGVCCQLSFVKKICRLTALEWLKRTRKRLNVKNVRSQGFILLLLFSTVETGFYKMENDMYRNQS